MRIEVLPEVRFALIPQEMIDMFLALYYAGRPQGADPVITGAAGLSYPAGKVHRAGYAIDVRSSNIPDPEGFAQNVRTYLRAVSPHYKVLYGDPAHLDHIHIGFAWWFSADERERRADRK